MVATMAGAAQAQTLPPRDECSRDRALVDFRARLAGAVAQRDSEALLALVAPDVHINFGGTRSKRAFVREWKLDRPGPSKIWAELDKLLALGCALDKGEASIPYLFARLPDDRDPFETFVPVKPGVNLRAAPSLGARVVKLLNWDILTSTDGYSEAKTWFRVRTDAGVEGYVRADLLQSPAWYRAIIAKRHGRWTITAFIAGD